MVTNDQIFRMLNDMKKDLTDITVKLAMQNKDISQNTKDLTEHIDGVVQNRARIEIHSAQLSNLQRPGEVWTSIRMWSTWIGGLALLAMTIYNLIP